jgi:hypothetical protein
MGGLLMSQRMLTYEEIWTHKYLWQSANVLLEAAKSNETESYYFLLPALFMSYAAFEAFINFCGYIILPEIWANEREYFKGKDNNVEAKISKLLEILNDFEWKKGQKPYQTIRDIGKERDLIAHGKVNVSEYESISIGDGSHIKLEHEWDRSISTGKVEGALHDIKSFCQSLTESMRKQDEDHPELVFDAFEGWKASADSQSI